MPERGRTWPRTNMPCKLRRRVSFPCRMRACALRHASPHARMRTCAQANFGMWFVVGGALFLLLRLLLDKVAPRRKKKQAKRHEMAH